MLVHLLLLSVRAPVVQTRRLVHLALLNSVVWYYAWYRLSVDYIVGVYQVTSEAILHKNCDCSNKHRVCEDVLYVL